MLQAHSNTKPRWFTTLGRRLATAFLPSPPVPLTRPNLSQLARSPEGNLPLFVRESPVAMKYLRLLACLEWDHFPERSTERRWPGHQPLPDAPFVAAYLVKLDQCLPHVSHLRRFLVEHPALVWVLGFPLAPTTAYSWGFDVAASLPSHRHFSRVLRELSNDRLQGLLDGTVRCLRAALPASCRFGKAIAVDTKHILAWVKENNPKAYIKEGRYDKGQHPAGDPDCRLGCKRRSNQSAGKEPTMATPTKEGQPAGSLGVSAGEFYWGYASGVVATKVPGWGEFVLAELTQTFDQSDASYFHPLMAMTERRLGFRPPFGALDAAFDAFYVYEYFHAAGGFAAVPLAAKGGRTWRAFDEAGRPLCEAGLSMPLKHTFINRTSLVSHERGRYACPLLFPEATGETCPINHKNWTRGGCTTTLATSVGARIRYQLDRESDAYKQLYRQRTVTERINSQALALSIERPKLRNQRSIANLNTLIYVLINLRALQRVLARRATQDADCK